MTAFFLVMGVVYALDVLTKMVVRSKMPLGGEIPLLPFFSLVHVNNTGIAFGMFQGRNLFFIALGAAVLAYMFFHGAKSFRQDRFSSLVIAGVLGGALGNLTDRVLFGHVTDFLDFYWGVHHWPAFNVADSSICVGAALLIWHAVRTPAV